ncbi:MAG: DUF433 domain-containing protein [Anaerolineae bacterium]|nr:DUF433 domain-containing protein [Anaerolineae bacterium]
MNISSYTYIARDVTMHGGELTVCGSAVTVRTIVERTQLGETPEQIVEAYPVLMLVQVHAALGYYYDHTEEIYHYIRENREALW